MERDELERILRMIAHQESSTILGGMQSEYEELQSLGYVEIKSDDVHPSAILTAKGKEFVHSLPPDPDR
jgi:hypothetical protein